MSDNRHRIGFVPEMLNILSKYNLSDFLTNYTKNADFPGKPHWKRIVVDAVNQKHDYDWQTRINLDNDFNRFRRIHFSVSISSVWIFPTNCSELRTAKFITKLISSVPHNNKQSCEICKPVCKYIFIHASLSFPNTSKMCSIWWDLIIEQFPVELYAELSECNEESLILILLGKDPSTDLCTFDLDAFKRLCYIHLVKSSAEYNRILTTTVHN
jgi:hypothetical protein